MKTFLFVVVLSFASSNIAVAEDAPNPCAAEGMKAGDRCDGEYPGVCEPVECAKAPCPLACMERDLSVVERWTYGCSTRPSSPDSRWSLLGVFVAIATGRRRYHASG